MNKNIKHKELSAPATGLSPGSGLSSMAFDLPPAKDKGELIVEGLRQNNLKNINLRIPHDKITAVVGPSGSGKSTLAFDTLFAEGRWRFVESLSTYTRLFLERMDRPKLDNIRNVRPAIAIEQKNPVRTSRSTVGTATELNDYLRILFARIGRLHCTECKTPVEPTDPVAASEKLLSEHDGKKALVGFTVCINDISKKNIDKETKDREIKKIFATLLSKGFIRIKAGSETIDISEPGFKPEEISSNEIKVITDRLVLSTESKGRLVDSLETAFYEGGQRAWVEVLGGEEPGNSIFSFTSLLECRACGEEVEKPTPLLFSFNHPVGACPECRGFGNILKYDESKFVPDPGLTLRQGAIEPWTKPAYTWWYEELEKHADAYAVCLDTKFCQLSKEERRVIFDGTDDFDGINGFFSYLETKKYKLHVRVFLSRYSSQFGCPGCSGARLKKRALSVLLGGLNISEFCDLTIEQADLFFRDRDKDMSDYEKDVSKEALRQIKLKLEFLNQTGLGYLTLSRLTRTLSGGEAQRVTLANQLTSALSGVLYILDEPSVGLHPRDITLLVEQIEKLKARSNTVVVVEHDLSIVKATDYVVELGPGSGDQGGRLVYAGTTKGFLNTACTLTSQYLTGEKEIKTPQWRRKGKNGKLRLTGARGNNLKSVDLTISLGTLTCVTGVSGSGKSTLIMDTLVRALAPRFGIKTERALAHDRLSGAENVFAMRLINQEPIGKTPRSNPITYIGGFNDIRKYFAGLKQSAGAGLTPGNFSFNVPGGRCESCKGEGVEKLEMYFLPDMYVKCESCDGKRYKTQVLEIKHLGRNIFDVLNMTFDEAYGYFADLPALTKKIAVLREVGLGYLKLGQAATTLSGGEAQRLKIARELTGKDEPGCLYILDEPTTGLHPDDIKKLLSVLGRLVDTGNTVIVIEHNLDCIKTADCVIDLGPEGGDGGGEIIATGTPEEVAITKGSHTGRYLRGVLGEG